MGSAANTNSGSASSAPGSRAALSGTPVAHEAAVLATGARTDESGKRELFKENTTTALVFPNGGVIRLAAAAAPGQLLFLTNPQSRREVVAQVTRRRNNPGSGYYIELEFTEPAPDFWGVKFPESAVPQAAPSAPQAQSAEPTIAPAAAEFLQPAEPGSDDLSPNAPAPSVDEVMALMEEVEALRAQLKSMQTQPAPAAAAPADSAAHSAPSQTPSPTPPPAPNLGVMLSSLVAANTPQPPPPSDSPALSDSLVPSVSGASSPQQQPLPKQTPAAHEPDELDDTLLPKPALDFRNAKVAPPNSIAHAPVVPPSDRTGMLRLALLTVVSLFAVTLAAWNMHWLPWLSPKSNVTDHPASGPQTIAKSPTSPRPTTPPKPSAAPSAAAATPNNSPADGAPKVAADATANSAAQPTSSNTTENSSASTEAKPRPSRAESAAPITPVSKRSAVRDSQPSDASAASSPTNDGSITPPRLIKSVRAVAPGDALRQFMTGNVTLDALIDKTGEVKSMKVLSGPPSFHKAAMEALKQYRYEPARQNGKPVSAHITVTIPFWFEP